MVRRMVPLYSTLGVLPVGIYYRPPPFTSGLGASLHAHFELPMISSMPLSCELYATDFNVP